MFRDDIDDSIHDPSHDPFWKKPCTSLGGKKEPWPHMLREAVTQLATFQDPMAAV